MALIPNYWEFKTPIKAHKDVLVWRPYAGPTQTRTFGAGAVQHEYELGNSDDEEDQFFEIKTFWIDRYPGVSFELYDPISDETRSFEFDSDLSFHYNENGGVAWKVLIKEVYPYAIIP